MIQTRLFFKKFKKSRLNIDEELYKKAKYDASKLITTKKQAFFKEKLSETIGNLKNYGNLQESLAKQDSDL